jgi:hypothetical protein
MNSERALGVLAVGFATAFDGLVGGYFCTYGTAAARTLQKATTTVPIVFAAAVDLVAPGLWAKRLDPLFATANNFDRVLCVRGSQYERTICLEIVCLLGNLICRTCPKN